MIRATTALVFLLLLLGGLPAHADEEAARFFSGRGDKAVADGNLDDAEKNYTKALGEKDGYLPALLGLARVWQGRNDKGKAIGYLTAILDRSDQGGLNDEQQKVADAAVDLMKQIDQPRLEYRQLVHDYVAKLAALARRSAKKSPELASRCLARIRDVAPDSPVAAALEKELGISPAAAGSPAAKAAAPNETLLFDGKDLEGWSGGPPVWTVSNGMVLATAPDGAFYMRHSELLSGDYTIVFEVRVKEDTSKTPVIGFEWAFTGAYDNYVALMFSDKFLMEHNHGGPKDKEKLARVDFYQVKGGVDRTVFNRFEIRVKGVRAAFYVNGHEVFHYDAPENVFKGVPAILVQDCTAEIRKISVIRPDSGKK